MPDEANIRLRPGLFYLVASVAAVCLIVAAGFSWLWISLHAPYLDYPGEAVLFEVSKGMSLREIAEHLEDRGIVQSSELFRLYARAVGKTKSLKAGEYQFDHPVSLIEVVKKIDSGDVHYHRVTVPEGLDLVETAAVFVASGFGSFADFEEATRLVALVFDIDQEAKNLEGYLFPDTYFLTRATTASEIVRGMVARFSEFWTEDLGRRAQELRMSPRQVVTLASLIEKEASLPQERELVSAVFHNRLAKRIRLACDPTVIYAVKQIKEYDGVINRSDLEIDSPYNTYLYPGLPPGPIANPGAEAILAALDPAESEYLYFVSKNDGSHIFSKTYAEHSRAVRRYQR